MSPRPLYKVAEWMDETILNETLGISGNKLHDRRLGDFLDAIHPHIDNIWKNVIHQAFAEYEISLKFIHYVPLCILRVHTMMPTLWIMVTVVITNSTANR